MSKTTDTHMQDILSRFLQALETNGDRGSFALTKHLQDLLLRFAGTDSMEMLTAKDREEWLYRFQLVCDTMYDLETLAAQEPTAAPG